MRGSRGKCGSAPLLRAQVAVCHSLSRKHLLDRTQVLTLRLIYKNSQQRGQPSDWTFLICRSFWPYQPKIGSLVTWKHPFLTRVKRAKGSRLWPELIPASQRRAKRHPTKRAGLRCVLGGAELDVGAANAAYCRARLPEWCFTHR
jgi:hypothetical protein